MACFNTDIVIGEAAEDLFTHLDPFYRRNKLACQGQPDLFWLDIPEELKCDLYANSDSMVIECISNIHREIDPYRRIPVQSPGGPYQSRLKGARAYNYFFVHHKCYYQFHDLDRLIQATEENGYYITVNSGHSESRAALMSIQLCLELKLCKKFELSYGLKVDNDNSIITIKDKSYVFPRKYKNGIRQTA